MRILAALLAALVLVSLAATAGSSSGAPGSKKASAAFAFGRRGGNIAPFSVAIARDGRVTAQGAVQLASGRHVVSAEARSGLLRLARAERFFSLARTVSCSGTLPDVASLFVTVRRATGTKTVTVHGGCNARFGELYAVLSAVAGVAS